MFSRVACVEGCATYEISAAHTTVLSSRGLRVLSLLRDLFFGHFLVHPRPLPLCKRLRRDRRQVRPELMSLRTQ